MTTAESRSCSEFRETRAAISYHSGGRHLLAFRPVQHLGIAMADHLSRTARSKLMSRIPSRNTRPELLLRSLLHQEGFRFRVHVQDLPGTPDIVLVGRRAAIFVNGCFWHHHAGCRRATVPATRVGFWRQKISRNMQRDQQAIAALHKMGWSVRTVWQCQLTVVKAPRQVARLKRWLSTRRPTRAR